MCSTEHNAVTILGLLSYDVATAGNATFGTEWTKYIRLRTIFSISQSSNMQRQAHMLLIGGAGNRPLIPFFYHWEGSIPMRMHSHHAQQSSKLTFSTGLNSISSSVWTRNVEYWCPRRDFNPIKVMFRVWLIDGKYCNPTATISRCRAFNPTYGHLFDHIATRLSNCYDSIYNRKQAHIVMPTIENCNNNSVSTIVTQKGS